MSKSWFMRMAAAGLVAVTFVGAVACGGDDDDAEDDGGTPAAEATSDGGGEASAEEQAVQDAVSGVFAAWNAKDVDALVAGFTDAGIVNVFGEEGQTAEEVAADLGDFIGSDQISDEQFGETAVDGVAATTVVQFAVGGAFDKSEFGLVDEDGAWKIDTEEQLSPDAPEGVTLVHVDLNEFAFGVNTNDIEDGNVAFEASNVGEQGHELGLVAIPADANVDDLLQQFAESQDGDVPGVVFIGGTDTEPGQTMNLVLVDPLESGRYLMLCFFPDTTEGEDGTPHAFKGMIKEFTVE